jgi:two-component system, NtrC family, sensor kinase
MTVPSFDIRKGLTQVTSIVGIGVRFWIKTAILLRDVRLLITQFMELTKRIGVILCLMAYVSLAVAADRGRQQQLQAQLIGANDTERMTVYNDLARSFVYVNPDSTIYYANKALKLASALKDAKGMADAYSNLGIGYYFRNDYDRLLDYYRQSLETYRKIGDERSISTLSSTYYRLAQNEKALENFKKSLVIYQNEKRYLKQIETLRSIGDVYRNTGDYADAVNYYSQAIALLNKHANLIGDTRKIENEMGQLLVRMGETFVYRGLHKESLVFFGELETLARRNEDWQLLAATLNNIAGAHFFMGQTSMALNVYMEALEMQKAQNDYYGASMSLLNMARIHQGNKQFAKAMDCHQKSLRLADIDGAKDIQRENYLAMSKLYAAMDNYREAYRYHALYSDLSGMLSLNENVKQFINTMAIHDLEQRNREKQILEAKNENYRLKLEKEALVRWRISFAFIILFVVLLAWFAIYRYVLKRRENINLEERIREALKKQEEQQQIIVHQSSLTSLGELAAGIAHEINQPMQNISLSAEGVMLELGEEQPDNGFIKQSVGEIFEDIVRVREIVDHIRLFSSGQKDMIWEPFDVSDCVRSALSMVGRQLANRHVALELALADQMPAVMGNPHKFEQVVINLVNNARDAVEERRNKQADWPMQIVIRAFQRGRKVVLEVEDNGVGIPPRKFTDVFLPFYTTKQLGKGTGLGLSICHSIVKEMDGAIEAGGKDGEGALFRVSLPVPR